MARKITIQINADAVRKLRAKAIADGLPNARSIPDEELLSALIQAAVGEKPEITVTEGVAGVVWVTAAAGLNLIWSNCLMPSSLRNSKCGLKPMKNWTLSGPRQMLTASNRSSSVARYPRQSLRLQ